MNGARRHRQPERARGARIRSRIALGVLGLALSATASAGATLTLTSADGHDFVRYGQTLAYLVTLTNSGAAATSAQISIDFSPAWDADGASWVCHPGSDGATCTASGSGPLNDTAMLPPGARASWVVSVPTRPDTAETTATLTVSATGAAPVSDTNALVVFKDGFDVPYGDGTQELPSPER